MSAENRKRLAASPYSGNLVSRSFSFQRQPARVLIVDALPPWWSETCVVLCEALDNFLSLACSLDGPCRIPLLSLYAISRQQECLLPFVQVRGNLARLRACVEELRSIPSEGCVRVAVRRSELMQQAVLDSLQQFKHYIRHTSTGNQASNNTYMEVTVVTSQPGQGIVHQLEMGLKGADLVSLKRLLVVQIRSTVDWIQATPSPETADTDTEASLLLGTEVDLQRVENSVIAMESVLKVWLQEQGGDREHLHLLLPNPLHRPIPVCLKCDMQECLINPTLIPLTPNLGVKTESIQDFLPVTKSSANQSTPQPQRLKAIKVLRADGVCGSVLFGLPLVIRPTTCWQLDWDELETNHNLFCALCHTLRSHDLFLLLQLEPVQRAAAGSSDVDVCSYYILQPCSSFSFLLKPAVSRELLLPCPLAVSTQDPTDEAMRTVQACLTQLDEEFFFNPLSLGSNLYHHLRTPGLLSQPWYPYRLQPAAAHRDQHQPAGGPKTTGSRHARQSHSRQLGTNSKGRAIVAPLQAAPSHSSSTAPPPAKASRPALTLLSSSSSSRSRRAPGPSQQKTVDNKDDCVGTEQGN